MHLSGSRFSRAEASSAKREIPETRSDVCRHDSQMIAPGTPSTSNSSANSRQTARGIVRKLSAGRGPHEAYFAPVKSGAMAG